MRYLKLLAVAVVLFAAACSSPTDEPKTSSGIEDFGTDTTGNGSCGTYTVAWRSPEIGSSEGPKASVTVREDDEIVLKEEAADEFGQLRPLWCGDATGDGRVELAIQGYSGGAHCCFSLRVDTLGSKTLLDADLGNVENVSTQQLDGKGPLELVTASDVLAYFDLPFAASPYLPRVYALRGGRYVDATDRFPAHIRSSLRSAWKALDQALDEDPGYFESRAGAAIGVYGHYVLLGKPSEGLKELARRAPEDVVDWVKEHADRAGEAIRTGTSTAGT